MHLLLYTSLSEVLLKDPIGFVILFSIYICYEVFLFSLLISSLAHLLFKSVLFNFHVFVKFLAFFLLISIFKLWWSEKIVDMISVFNLLRLALCPFIWSVLESVLHAHEKIVYSSVIEWNILYTPVKSIWPKIWFNSNAFLLSFCL